MQRCSWPALGEPFRTALEQAVAFIFTRFEPDGIVAAGRIVRGNPHAAALSKLGAKKGGKARWEGVSAEERRELARKAARARWGKRGR